MVRLNKQQKTFLGLLLSIAPAVSFEQVISAAVNMIDTIMIGHSMGVSEVAAVGLANQVLFLFFLMVFGIISASTVFSGQYFGKGDINSIHKIMGIGFVGSSLTALLFFLPAFFVPHLVMSIYSSDPIVIELGARFLRITSFSYFFVAITFTRSSAMRSIRQTRIPMITTSIALVLNVTLNYIVIFVLNKGLEGVAWTTLISRGVELLFQQYLIQKYKIPINTKFKNYFNFNKEFVRKFINIGGFIIINEVTWAIGNSAYNVAYGIIGTDAQGSMQMSMAMVNMFQVFGNAIAISTSIIVSNTLGSGKHELAVHYAKYCIYFSVFVAVLMGILLILFASPLATFYNLDTLAHTYVVNILFVAGITMVLRTLNFTIIVGILRSGGDTKWCFYLEIITVYLLGLPLAFFSALIGLPIYIVYLMISVEELVKLIISGKRMRTNNWANTIV